MDKQRTSKQSAKPEARGGFSSTRSGPPGPQTDFLLPPTWFSQPNGLPGTSWMPVPLPLLNCPPGLEYLSQTNMLMVHQQVELLEAITGFETVNKYEIKNRFGTIVYFAEEDTDCCTRFCCGVYRCFTIKILANTGQEVIILKRPLRCNSCFFPCCMQKLEVQAPPGIPIGYITQIWHPCIPKFSVQNENREEVLKIIGPPVTCSCGGDIDFEIKSLDEQTVLGKISKQWAGFVKEIFTDTDNFGIQFPIDLDVKMKAVMLGACFLIDFMFFESSRGQRQKIGVW